MINIQQEKNAFIVYLYTTENATSTYTNCDVYAALIPTNEPGTTSGVSAETDNDINLAANIGTIIAVTKNENENTYSISKVQDNSVIASEFYKIASGVSVTSANTVSNPVFAYFKETTHGTTISDDYQCVVLVVQTSILSTSIVAQNSINTTAVYPSNLIATGNSIPSFAVTDKDATTQDIELAVNEQGNIQYSISKITEAKALSSIAKLKCGFKYAFHIYQDVAHNMSLNAGALFEPDDNAVLVSIDQNTEDDIDDKTDTTITRKDLHTVLEPNTTYTYFATLYLTDLNNNPISKEYFLNESTGVSKSVLLLDYDTIPDDYNLVKQTDKIVSSQNSGSAVSFDPIQFDPPISKTTYITNLIVQTSDPIFSVNTNVDSAVTNSVLSAIGITKYATIAAIENFNDYLDEAYVNYSPVISGNLKLKLTELAANSLTLSVSSDFSAEYNGAEHPCYSTNGNSPIQIGGLEENDIIYFSEDGTTYTETVPTYKNAGTKTIYVKVKRDDLMLYPTPSSISLTVQKAKIRITALNNTKRNYDGTTDTDIAALFSGVCGNDQLTIKVNGQLDSKNAGTYTISNLVYEFINCAETALNYEIDTENSLSSTTYTIDQLEITLTGLSVDPIVQYATDLTATVEYTEINGIKDGDDVTITFNGTYKDSSTSGEKDVTVNITLGGDDKDNYYVKSTTATGTVTPALDYSVTADGSAAETTQYLTLEFTKEPEGFKNLIDADLLAKIALTPNGTISKGTTVTKSDNNTKYKIPVIVSSTESSFNANIKIEAPEVNRDEHSVTVHVYIKPDITYTASAVTETNHSTTAIKFTFDEVPDSLNTETITFSGAAIEAAGEGTWDGNIYTLPVTVNKFNDGKAVTDTAISATVKITADGIESGEKSIAVSSIAFYSGLIDFGDTAYEQEPPYELIPITDLCTLNEDDTTYSLKSTSLATLLSSSLITTNTLTETEHDNSTWYKLETDASSNTTNQLLRTLILTPKELSEAVDAAWESAIGGYKKLKTVIDGKTFYGFLTITASENTNTVITYYK